MDILKAGREPTKIEVSCPHCGALYKLDQRHIMIRWVNVTARQAIVMTQCRHCINPFILNLRQQAEMGITYDMLFNAWLVQLACLSERGKRELAIRDEGGFIAHLEAVEDPKLGPTIALQSSTPPQSPQQSEPAECESFEVPQ